MRQLLALGVLVLLASTQAYSDDPDTELPALLLMVEQSGCTFIRNGDEHDAEAAADHLRLKSRRGKKYYDTTDQFIDRLATKSSWSGKRYTVQCPGQDLQGSGEWLHRLLGQYRSTSSTDQAGR